MKTHPPTDVATSAEVPAADREITGIDHAPAIATKPTVDDLQDQVDVLKKAVAALNSLLRGVTRERRTLLFTGVNLQIVNGTKTTDGTPNGLGNLILGYNAPRSTGTTAADRAGSHALVIGDQHHWSSYGHIVAGFSNTASGPSASVTGGRDNAAQGDWASVSGGRVNIASGDASSVSGGRDNIASNGASAVSGGVQNEAIGGASSVSGGGENKAIGPRSSVSGGDLNKAEGIASSVSGGVDNTAVNARSSVSGGHSNQAIGVFSSILGGTGVELATPSGCHSC